MRPAIELADEREAEPSEWALVIDGVEVEQGLRGMLAPIAVPWPSTKGFEYGKEQLPANVEKVAEETPSKK